MKGSQFLLKISQKYCSQATSLTSTYNAKHTKLSWETAAC